MKITPALLTGFLFSFLVHAQNADVEFTSFKTSGRGCPAIETVGSFSTDKKTLSVLFGPSSYSQVGIGSPGRIVKYCSIEVGIHVPAGTMLTDIQNDLRGFVTVPAKSRARITNAMGWKAPPRARYRFFYADRGHQTFLGPLDEDVLITQHAAFFDYAGCAEQNLVLRINLAWDLLRNPQRQDSLFGFDSSDFDSKGYTRGFFSGLNSAPCPF